MECNLVWVWNHTRDFKIERVRKASSIWNHKYDFRPKLHDPKFSYHFIRSILKSHNFMALNFRFWCNVPSRAGLLEITKPETLWHLIWVCKAMSCDENSFEHNKQTSSSEVRTKTASFLHQSSIGLITVFDAILTGRQRGQKLQCLYGNPIENNFFQNWILHNLWIATLKY